MDRPAKLQKLNDLRRAIPQCSKVALEGILKEIAAHGVPELGNRKQMKEAAESHLKQFCTYGPLLYKQPLVLANGGTVELQMVNFHSLLDASCRMGGSFFQWLCTAMETTPSSPEQQWNLVLYSDECLPANALGRAAKKVWVVYCSFKELGRQALSHTHHWLPLCIVRSSIVTTLEGHMSQVMRVILEDIFTSSKASPSAIGLLLHGPDDLPLRIYFKLGFFSQDGASQKVTFGLKGDAGSNYCLKCSNQIVFLLQGEADSEKAVLKAIAKSSLVLSTNEEALQSFDRLAARQDACSTADFKLWEQCTGWTFSKQGLLASQALRPFLQPVTQFVHDYMHGMCSNGCLNVAMFLVLEHLQQQGLPSWTSMSAYLKLWTLPQMHQKVGDLAAYFSEGKVESSRKAFRMKMDASETRTFYPILQHHILKVEAEVGATHQTTAFLKLCEMMDMLCATQFGCVSGQLLDITAEAALMHFKHAKWGDHCIKKFHWLLHYGDAYEAHRMLLPCWTMERKHKDITAVATRVQNLKNFEESICVEVLSQQLHNMKIAKKDEAALQQPTKASKRVVSFLQTTLGLQTAEIFTGNRLVLIGGGLAMSNDIVLFKNEQGTWDGGKILLHFAIGRQTWSLVSPLLLASYDRKNGHATWTPTGSVICVAASDILIAVTYCKTQSGFKTLVPFHLR